jgi:hypothetical protein
MRVEGIVLEDHRQAAVARRLVVHPLAADVDVALGYVEQADDHLEQRRLAGPGRADEDHELAIGDLEADVVHRRVVAAESLRDVPDRDLAHLYSSSFSLLRPRR